MRFDRIERAPVNLGSLAVVKNRRQPRRTGTPN